MRTGRFPRQAYVRQLEKLYEDLTHWRDTYIQARRNCHTLEEALPFAQRERHLEQVQSKLVRVIMAMDDTPRLS